MSQWPMIYSKIWSRFKDVYMYIQRKKKYIYIFFNKKVEWLVGKRVE